MSFLFCCLFLRFLYLKRLGLFQEKKMVHFFSFLNRKTPQEEEEQEEPQKKKRTACFKNSNGSLLLVSRTALLEELLVSRTARRTACFKNSNGSLLLVSRTALLEELLVSRTACFKNSKKWCFLVLLFKEKIRCCSAVLLFCCSAVLLFCCSAVLLFCCSAILLFSSAALLVSRIQRKVLLVSRKELLVSRIQKKDVLSFLVLLFRKENTGSLNRRTPCLLNNGIVSRKRRNTKLTTFCVSRMVCFKKKQKHETRIKSFCLFVSMVRF